MDDDPPRRKNTKKPNRKRPLSLRQLEIFLEAAKYENFGAASKELGLSPAYISEAIRDLELALGPNVTLFDREKTGAKLTAAGRLLAERGTRILADVEATTHDIAKLDQTEPTVVKVAYDPVLACLVTGGIKALFEALPGSLKVEVTETSSVETIAALFAAAELDIAFSYVQHNTGDDVGATPVGETRLALVTSTRHPLSREASVTLSALEQEPLALPRHPEKAIPSRPTLRDSIEKYFDAHGFTPRRVVFVSNTEAFALGLVRAGFAVTIAAGFYTELAKQDDLCCVPLSPKPPSLGTVYASHRKGGTRSLVIAKDFLFRDVRKRLKPPSDTKIDALPDELAKAAG